MRFRDHFIILIVVENDVFNIDFSIFVYMFNFTGWSNLGATYSVFGLDGRTTRDCDTVSTDHPVISMVTVFLYSFYHFEGTVDDRC